MKKYLFLVPVLFILGCGGGSNGSTESKVDKKWQCFCDNEIKALTSIKNTYGLDLPFKITGIEVNKCEIAPRSTKVDIGDLTGYGYDSNGVFWAEIQGGHYMLDDLIYNDYNFSLKPNEKTYILTDILLPFPCYTNKVTINYNIYYSLVKEKKKIVVNNPQYDQSKVYVLPNDDPLYKYQWHLKNTGQSFAVIDATPGQDINVEPVWKEGITGKGVKVAVIDTGVDMFHPDLKDNIDWKNSYNYHSASNNPTPIGNQPVSILPLSYDSAHGTAVAGIIAAKGWNGIGTRGVAPNASIVSLNALELSDKERSQYSGVTLQVIRLLDALVRNIEEVDIYNNSWGGDPTTLTDDYMLADYRLGAKEFDTQVAYGSKFGRGGKGSIYIKSAGNSGIRSNASFEQAVTNGYWIVTGAVGANGYATNYSTPGSAILVSAPGGGVNPSYTKQYAMEIVTTDLAGDERGFDRKDIYATLMPHFDVKGNENYDYTYFMNGTSAAAPNVSGVVALMLEANPNLTYRDVQIILARTARKPNPDNIWETNAAGLHFNYYYGFGIVDAKAAVDMAKNFKSVGGFNDLKILKYVNHNLDTISSNGKIEYNITFDDDITIENAILAFTIENNAGDTYVYSNYSKSGTDDDVSKYKLYEGTNKIEVSTDNNITIKIYDDDDNTIYEKLFTEDAKDSFDVPKEDFYYVEVDTNSTTVNWSYTITTPHPTSPTKFIAVELVSPSGTTSLLIDQNNTLTDQDHFNYTRVLSTNFLDEKSKGTWTVIFTSTEGEFKLKAIELNVTGH